MKKTAATHIVFVPGHPESVTLAGQHTVDAVIARLHERLPYLQDEALYVEAVDSPRLSYAKDSPGCLESRKRVCEAALDPDRSSASVRFLDLLASRPDGMRFKEIQRALWDMRGRSGHGEMPRGWWCTNLLGCMFHHAGLLHTYATKGSDGRWHRNSTPHDGKPWSKVERTPKGYARGFAHKY